MSVLTRVLGAAGVVGGVVGAVALGGVTAQKVAVRRAHKPVDNGGETYDSIDADRNYSVVAADGAALQVEEVGPLDAPLTVVLVHGWALRMGSWYYQRRGLTGPDFGAATPPAAVEVGAETVAATASTASAPAVPVRLVFYDQRSHGRSSRGPEPHPSVEMLGQDLAAVLATAVPHGPVVLVGHSMGGMSVLALAGADPTYMAARVAGVGLLSTSATQTPTAEIGRIFLRGSNPVVKVVSNVAARYSTVLERSRPVARDAVWLVTRLIGFARKDVPVSLVDYLDEMLSDTPIEVIADFVPGVLAHDQTAALPALAGIPALVLCGDSDRITPPAQSRFLADALPDAEFVLVERAGHLAMMEAPEETNDALRRLLHRAQAYVRRMEAQQDPLTPSRSTA
ncbi:alpha/beta fold hydrolase [Nakamurella deserti]|uniref:alpha/beta fold hydrolase n=1 Tax=Nakamurella deserti TaxID=2164074 RepID=UPI0013003A8F|nr:alpha/beta hydrolase [Nakamurella deserti]